MTRREFLAGAAGASALALGACRGSSTLPAGPIPAELPDGLRQVVVLDAQGSGGFAAYLEEILATEGVLGVDVVQDAAELPGLPGLLGIVSHGDVRGDEAVRALVEYVTSGGTLVAVLPGAALLAAFEAAVADGAPRAIAGMVFDDEPDEAPLRVHVAAQPWRVTGAPQVLAWAVDGRGDRVGPAAIAVRVGRGQASFWSFDVARNVALIRQGDPLAAGKERDGLAGVRLVDALSHWVVPERVARPDADVMQRALVAPLAGTASRGPLVRADYFPHGHGAVAIATCDAIGTGWGTLDALLRRAEAAGAHMSVYYAPPSSGAMGRALRHARWALGDALEADGVLRDPGEPPSPGRVADWLSRGHEFMPLPDAAGASDGGVLAAWQAFAREGYDTTGSTARTRDAAWSGWEATAAMQASRGIRMNLDAWSIGPALKRKNGEWAHGHLVGSGLPQRFASQTGDVVDCYQQPVQLVDAQLLAAAGGAEQLSGEAAAHVAESLVARAVSASPAAIAMRVGADAFAGEPLRAEQTGAFLDGVLEACRRHEVPVWSAARWLAFLDARRATAIVARTWDHERGALTCDLDVGMVPSPELSVMVPESLGDVRLDAVRLDGAAVSPSTRAVAGIRWACVGVTPGKHRLDAHYR